MPRGRIKSEKRVAVESYSHKGKKRKNNPPVGLVSSATDKVEGRTKYQHDPHIDPYLSWAGKQEGTEFDVQNVSLHIHERIDPKRITKAFVKQEKDPAQKQLSLFEEPDNDPPLNKAVDFYRHEQDWTNRLIAGDSLLVMNSLLKKEGMAGKVQMVYLDPPYGIKYNSNFQPFVNKRDVKDGNDGDIPAEPEMIQAFRDTWELGIHSYLTYLRERLFLAKELLHESGSCFVQISDENLHHVHELMNELFGASNFCSIIQFKKTAYQETELLPNVCDFLIWYAKDKRKVKCHQLYQDRPDEMIESGFTWLELEDGEITKAPKKISQDPLGSKRFQSSNLTSQGSSAEGSKPFEYNGVVYEIGNNKHWKTSIPGLNELGHKGRLFPVGKTLSFKRYAADFPFAPFTNMWDDTIRSTFAAAKLYVVETNPKVIERCMLMTTDPGELVLDPTCGSGTTGYVAELWGRRWITCDTSRVAITLTKQRLMTAKFDYWELAHSNEGVRSGFKYQTVPHITLRDLANNLPSQQETLYDQPLVERDKVRVTGPFTVEAVPSLRVKPFDGKEPIVEVTKDQLARTGETGRQAEWRDELKATGIRTIGNKIISFSRIEPMVATRFLHAEGEILEAGETKKAHISFGPDYGPLEQRQVEEAIKESRALKDKPDFVIFAAFHFDPEAAKDIDQINWPGVKILKAQMSVDLLTKDLRKKRSSSQSYWLIGQPDVEVKKAKDGKYRVTVNGFDYYDPVSGEIISRGTKHIAMWFLDTDYDERSLYPDQVFFPESDPKRDWTKLAKALNGEVNEELLEHFRGVESLPFSAGDQKKVAVKIIDNRGIESFVIKKLE
ncbi:MAG TPA: site-specific DNA-methyltransferase [Candidatus Omnitrophota bacterium]|nr:site-specific DNA-methyltransferase [Candidatus Omnitrophota bacterium]